MSNNQISQACGFYCKVCCHRMFLICMFIYNIYFHCLPSLVVFAFQGKFMDIQVYHYIDAWLYPQCLLHSWISLEARKLFSCLNTIWSSSDIPFNVFQVSLPVTSVLQKIYWRRRKKLNMQPEIRWKNACGWE